jgi:HAD superfamily hydrolase (TIGR01549 family)
MLRAVTFDFHNTLVTCDAWLDLEIRSLPSMVLYELRDYLAERGDPEPSTDEAQRLFRVLRRRVHESGVEISAVEGVVDVLRAMGIRVPRKLVAEAVEDLEYQLLDSVEVVDGAESTLERLKSAGYRLAVVSSAGFPQFVEEALEEHGLLPYFDAVLTSAGEGIYKSNPEIFRRAVERLGAAPEETVHVGDHARFDVATARAAGLHAIWFAANAERTARLHGADWDALKALGEQADAVVMRLTEVPGAVESIGGRVREG